MALPRTAFIASAALARRSSFFPSFTSIHTPLVSKPFPRLARKQPTATATQRRSTSTRAPTPTTPRRTKQAPPTRALPPGLHKAVPYFAYFSNMNPNKLGPHSKLASRRVPVLHTTPAILPAHRLTFDVPGLPPEPAFANLSPDRNSKVHGVLHWLSPSDFSRIALSEAIPPPGSLLDLLPSFLRLGETREVAVDAVIPDGRTVRVVAKTFFFYAGRIPQLLRPLLKPSRRYVQVAVDGAEFWGVDKAYVRDVLRKVDTAPSLGLPLEPRPHLLDRPNPAESFGKLSSEMYSPWHRIRAPSVAVKSFEEDELGTHGHDLRLVHLSNVGAEKAARLRKMYFIPGIDGTGKSITSQMHQLDEDGEYDVSTVVYPFKNRQTVLELANAIIDLVLDNAPGKPVSFVGESMGGVLAVMLAKENIRRRSAGDKALDIDLLLLLNPATCYYRSNPKALWEFLLSLQLPEAQYAALLPPVLLPFAIDMTSPQQGFGPSEVPRLRKILRGLNRIADVLPQDALSHRLKLLHEFSLAGPDFTELSGEHGPKDVALISSINDNMLPSLAESYRLQRNIPNLYSMILPYGGHVPLFDKRFSLANFLKPFKAVTKKTGTVAPQTVDAKILKRRAVLKKRISPSSSQVEDIDCKSHSDVRRLAEWLSEWTNRSHPVFIGEENIPAPVEGKPVLFISNHTLLGWLDGMYPTLRILQKKKVLLRKMAHPRLFDPSSLNAFPGGAKYTEADMKEFGVVMVSPNILLEQLCNGRWSILFPGGAREALKEPQDKKYSLFWPEAPEFIRPCALFGATIVPVSTVGAEDMVNLVIDSKTMTTIIEGASTLIGRPMDMWESFGDNARAWRGDQQDKAGLMVPPLALPAGADRLYFRFGKPIDVPSECLDDPVLCKKIYRRVRFRVEEGIDILVRRREADMYRSVEKRSEFSKEHGKYVPPPAGPAWAWTKGVGAYLDEDLQPPL